MKLFNFILEDYTTIRNAINVNQDHFLDLTKEDFEQLNSRLDENSKISTKEFEDEMTTLVELNISQDDIDTIVKTLNQKFYYKCFQVEID